MRRIELSVTAVSRTETVYPIIGGRLGKLNEDGARGKGEVTYGDPVYEVALPAPVSIAFQFPTDPKIEKGQRVRLVLEILDEGEGVPHPTNTRPTAGGGDGARAKPDATHQTKALAPVVR